MNPVQVCSILLTLSSVIAQQEYFIAFGKNYEGSESLKLFISSTEPGPVPVSVETLRGFNFSGFVTNNETLEVEIPNSFEVRSNTERDKGIRVISETQSSIVVNGLNYARFTADAFLALPCDQLPVEEYEYYGLSYYSYAYLGLSHFVIVGCNNNTVLQIGSDRIELNEMETYIWESSSVTGTRVTSNKPLAVFVGSQCTNVPHTKYACDHLTEQVPPTILWGKQFMSASFAGRSSGDLYRILASKASTSVTVNCNRINNTVYTLATAGSWQEFMTPAMSYCSIASDKPILVMQFALGANLDGTGDPFMMMITPINQYKQVSAFNVLPGFLVNFISIFVTLKHFQPQYIYVDNANLERATWNTVYCSMVEICGYVTYVNVTPGIHQLHHTDILSRVGLFVYGFQHGISYGYPGGLSFQMLCSRYADCSTEGVYTYTSDSQCRLCYEYGWVQEISEDMQSAVPQLHLDAMEGDNIHLSIFFLQNGPNNTDYITFTITIGGTAIVNVDYSISHNVVLELTNQPLPVHVLTVDNDVYEGTKTINLTLIQTNSSNYVTYESGLISKTVFITVEDNDELTVTFKQTTMVVAEDGGNIVVPVFVVGETAIPIILNITVSGTAMEHEDFIWASPRTLRLYPGGPQQYNNTINIINDAMIEGTESLTVSLTNPQPPDAVGTLSSMTIIINNDDFPHIGFEQTQYTSLEGKGSVNICISVYTGPLIESLIVKVNVRSRTATDDDFYFGRSPPTIEIPSRASRGCQIITIIGSVLVERDEEIHLSISEDTLAVIEDSATTLVIKDGGFVVLGFNQESYTINEGGLLKLIVSKSLPCDFDIHFRVHVDRLIYEEHILGSSDNRTVVSVTLPDDEVALEPDENYVLTLSLLVPDPQVELGSHLSYLTVVDDENTVTVGFDGLREINVAENIGSIEVSVSLRNDVAVPVSVDIAVINGTAIKGQDFNALGPLHHTFVKHGSQSFSVEIVDDSETEEGETFSLSLIKANPSDAVQFDPAMLHVTITDNESRESSSLPVNYLLLLPIVVLFMVVVVVIVTAGCCIRRRRRQKTLKTSSLQCSNPFSDQNDYDMAPTVRDEGAPQLNPKDETKFSNALSPTEHQSHPKSRVFVPARIAPPPPNQKPSASMPSHATEPQHPQRPQSMPNNASKPQSYRKPRVSVPEVAAKPTRSQKPKVSTQSSVVKPQCDKSPTGNAPISPAQPQYKQKYLPILPPSYQKPSVSAPSCSTELPSNKKPTTSTPTSGAQPKCEDVVKYENIGICLLPKPGVDDEPEVKENVAYRCIGITNSEYAVPQQLKEQQRERNALLPSEMQAVEAYAISTISKKL